MLTRLLLLALFLHCALASIRSVASKSHNTVRWQLSPPCDYRESKDSPCNGAPANKLPRVIWRTDLAKEAEKAVAACPIFTPRSTDRNLGQNIYLHWSPEKISGDKLMQTAVDSWQSKKSQYNAKTGSCLRSGDKSCYSYKQLIWSDCLYIGCAVNTECPNNRSVASCFYRNKVGDEPAFPPLYFKDKLRSQFARRIVKRINQVRKRVWPKRKEGELSPVSWDDALAAKAQEWADSTTDDLRFNPDDKLNGKQVGELLYRHPWKIYRNAASKAVARWWRRRGRYRIRKNKCYGRKCGEYTQLVHHKVSKVGCGQAWNKGQTIVVCYFDYKAANGRNITKELPYTPVERRNRN